MPTEPVRALRLHVGAHKTATTHFQKALYRHAEALRARGVDVIRPIELRSALKAVRGPFGLPLGEAAGFARAVASLRTGAGTLAISEENLIGSIRDLFEAEPYARINARLAAAARVAPRAPVALFLSIRGFDRLWPSAHAEALRHHYHDPERIGRLRALARSAPPSWLGVVDRLQQALPGATIRVWRQEDHAAHWREVAAAFVDVDPGSMPEVTSPKATMSPSAEGVRLAEEALARGERPAIAALYARHPARGGEPFMPFDGAEAAALRERYAADLEALRTRGLLLAFAEAPQPQPSQAPALD